jgi:hypothetical protein
VSSLLLAFTQLDYILSLDSRPDYLPLSRNVYGFVCILAAFIEEIAIRALIVAHLINELLQERVDLFHTCKLPLEGELS